MNDITNREDVSKLVHAFYEKIRKDKLLGRIFNENIKPEEWAPHLEKLTDFWETNLFGVPLFKGNPTAKHLKVDANENFTVSMDHFTHWVELWHQTIDVMFEGERANKAKHAAQKMSVGQFFAVLNAKPAKPKEVD